MSFAHLTAMNAYASSGLEVSVATADPHRLVLMLFEGALVAVMQAKLHMQNGATAAKGQAVSKAVRIIDEGLKASLDVGAGRELAQQLWQLYEYMGRRLLLASLHNEAAGFEEVERLLRDIKEAWATIKPAAANSAPATAAAAAYAQR